MVPPFSEAGPGLEGTHGLETCKRKVKSHHSPLTTHLQTPYRPPGQLLPHTPTPQTREKTRAQKGPLRTVGRGPKHNSGLLKLLRVDRPLL